MFFPRVLPEGMFPDGLTYASIARNMANGQGSFWSPYFSSSFWLSYEGDKYAFFGHPTLAMSVLSLFFRLFGDHWFVEKGFCIIVLGISLWLVKQIWQTQNTDKSLWWLPIFVWYLMPTVIWAYPVFILDNSMATFSLFATLLILRGSQKSVINGQWSFFYFLVAGVCLHLAFLTKGPVGLFPLAIPILYRLVYKEKTTFRAAFWQTFLLFITSLGTLALWYFYEPARFFWIKYFDIQLVSSISQNSQTSPYSWFNYLHVPQRLLIECLPLVGVGVLFFLFSKFKNSAFAFKKETNQRALLFLLIGLSGSLPMMISHKIGAFYLIPCLPFFALSFASWLEPTVLNWLEKHKISAKKTSNWVKTMVFLSVGITIYSFSQIGKIGREKDIIQAMTILRGAISDGQKICVCDSLMQDFNYHAYFQRYHRWELAKISDTTAQYFVGTEGGCRKSELDSIKQFFIKTELNGLKKLDFYKKR